MIYCRVCGSPNLDADRVCQVCGATLGPRPAAASVAGHGKAPARGSVELGPDEKIRVIVGNICLTPLLGTILYFVWKRDRPERARRVCVLTLWAAGIWMLLVVIVALIRLAAQQ